jgi:uncharacterized protein YutE (UPF0331/DUF86 family)
MRSRASGPYCPRTSRPSWPIERREVVVLNLFVALQDCAALAAHWLADSGADVPSGYRELFLSLVDCGVLDASLARKLAAATGLRNLVAHQYGVLDWTRIHEIASTHLDDLLGFCEALAGRAESGGSTPRDRL